LFNDSFDFRHPHIPETETLKQFRRVEKYANEAETVSVFISVLFHDVRTSEIKLR